MLERNLSPAQEKCLLRKHLTGDFPPRQIATISALVRHGMLEVIDRHYIVSAKGREYCDAYHMSIPS
jgi:hypothetical protein